jgi:TRAP-type C4-dicarboxylate transport system substrate-binding protein
MRTRSLLGAAALLALPAAPRAAEAVVIKLGTLAPAGSAWHVRLQELGERWTALSGGQVKLRIFPGGVQGSEGDMLRKIAIGQLDAASVSNVGLHDVAPEAQVVTVPALFESGEELGRVFPRIEPRIASALERKGIVALQWASVGQVRLFCTSARRTPAELAGARVFAWEGDPASADVWRSAGLRPVVLSSVDLVPSLQTGMIDCLANVPVYLLTARLFEKARTMIDFSWGTVMGATVIANRSWQRVPAELRPGLLKAARELSARVDADAARADAEAVAAMQRQGLAVLAVEPGPWRALAARSWTSLRGKVVPSDLFDEALRLRDEQRRGRLAAGTTGR